MPKCYCFDVDECIETSNGPVTVQMLRDLREQGHCVGLCGNLSAFIPKIPDWYRFISVTMNFDFGYQGGYLGGLVPKWMWLHCFQHAANPQFDEFIMVGNVFGVKNSLGFTCGSHDDEAARQAGWRFICEDDFARGVR